MECGVLLSDIDRALVGVLGHAGRQRGPTSLPQLVVDVDRLAVGAMPAASGGTHIWISRTGLAVFGLADEGQESFFSLCRMPAPALIRWAGPG